MPRTDHGTRKDAFQSTQDLVLRPLTRFLAEVFGKRCRNACDDWLHLQVNQLYRDDVLGVRILQGNHSS